MNEIFNREQRERYKAKLPEGEQEKMREHAKQFEHLFLQKPKFKHKENLDE